MAGEHQNIRREPTVPLERPTGDFSDFSDMTVLSLENKWDSIVTMKNEEIL